MIPSRTALSNGVSEALSIKLAVDGVEVVVDRLGGDSEVPASLFGAHAIGNCLEDFNLTIAQKVLVGSVLICCGQHCAGQRR